MNDLYNRQSSLTLKKYHTCFVIGCGGIGNWVALDLALSGCIRDLILIDPDKIELSNLNRTIFDSTDIGCYKVDAIARHIALKRCDQMVYTMPYYMTENLAKTIIEKYFDGDSSYYRDDVCVVDCRDDIYDDCYCLNCKLYKVGYDGAEITIDGNPRLTKVYGQRGGSYSVTPSYVCSSQLAAMLVVNDMLYPKLHRMLDKGEVSVNLREHSALTEKEDFPYLQQRACYEYDEIGRINDMVNIDCTDIIGKFVEDKHEYIIPNDTWSNLPNGGETENE